jgi:hypothetical protein
MTLMEQIKANGYEGKYDMVMNLAQAMLHGRDLDDYFVNERRDQMAKNKIRAANNQNELTEQIHDCAISELAIIAFDIQSG